MEAAVLLDGIRESLAAIVTPRLYETERGFQGALQAQIEQRLHLPANAIVEQEYQKRLQIHGIKFRPDIVIHEPFDEQRHGSRAEGNLAVVELKLRATAAEAQQDFTKITAMIQVLQYPLGIFINVSSTETYANLVPDAAKGRIVVFAVCLVNGRARVIEQRT